MRADCFIWQYYLSYSSLVYAPCVTIFNWKMFFTHLSLHLWGQWCWKMLPPRSSAFTRLRHTNLCLRSPLRRCHTPQQTNLWATSRPWVVCLSGKKNSRFTSQGWLSSDWLTHSSNRPSGGSGDQLEAKGTHLIPVDMMERKWAGALSREQVERDNPWYLFTEIGEVFVNASSC